MQERTFRWFWERADETSGMAPDRTTSPASLVTVGGTGKTPAVQWLARWLHAEGYRVAVVARGYGGSQSSEGAVVSNGAEVFLNARQAGDEPLIFGDFKPTGKLPMSWPRSMAQIPVNIGDIGYDPLFPYGFGLTYE